VCIVRGSTASHDAAKSRVPPKIGGADHRTDPSLKHAGWSTDRSDGDENAGMCKSSHPAPGCRARPHRSRHNAGSACAWRPRSYGSCSRRSCGHASWSSAHRGPSAATWRASASAVVRPACSSAFSSTTVPLLRHRHDTGVDDLPATRHVALVRKMLVEAVEQLLGQPGLGQLLAE
jgi:hypothetical protein